MQLLKSTSIIACLFLFVINTAQAATDYNSSRSNKSLSANILNDTEGLLKTTGADASAVASTMIAVDQKDGYTGEYNVTVDVRVSIERVVSPRDAASGRATGRR